MLLCITNQEDITFVSKYCEDANMYLEVMLLSEMPNITAALSRMRTISNFDYILFYLNPMEEEHCKNIRSAVKHIQTFYHSRIIIFAADELCVKHLFHELFDIGIRELVTVQEDTDLAAELEVCLSLEGKSLSDSIQEKINAKIEIARSYIRPDFVIPEDFRLTIAVAGAEHKIGVTTQAFSIYHALKALGFHPCIVDKGQRFIESLMTLYEDETVVTGSIVTVNNMDFAHDIQVGTGHNVFIFDMGVLSESNISDYMEVDLSILCAGSKPWEIGPFVQMEGWFGKYMDIILFSFSSEREKKIIEAFGLDYNVAFTPWNPDIWSYTNKEWHEELLIPMLKERLPHG